MHRATGALLAAGLTLVGATAGVTALAAPAFAAQAPVTTLSFVPATGVASTPMYIVVPQPCPAQATNVLARAFGHGFPATGQTVVTNQSSGISHSAAFLMPFQDSFVGFAADNGTKLEGPYQIKLSCINRLDTKTYASFSAAITFSDGGHFTAPAPPKSVVDAINAAAQNPGALPSAAPSVSAAAPKSGSGNGGPVAGTGPGATASHPAGSSATDSSGTSAVNGGAIPTAQNTKSDSGTNWQPYLVAGAVLLILLAIFLRYREIRGRRERQARRQPANNPTPDSDNSGDTTHTLTGSAPAKDHAKGQH